jgi:geranylgeranyl reductase family protein
VSRTIAVDVAVLGAGPAGSATAAVLAAAGARVVVADRRAFPRDKVCGDGLLPDATNALRDLGALSAVEAVAQGISGIRFEVPGGKRGLVPVAGLVAPRRVLDAVLVEHAARNGAEVLHGYSVEGFVGEAGAWRAVRLSGKDGEVTAEASWFVLATGAAPRPRALAGLGTAPRGGAAVRAYATLPGLAEDELFIRFDRRRLPRGYYWAFPLGGGRWNVGCGVFAASSGDPSLVEEARAFGEELGAAEWSGKAKGAPLLSAFPRLAVARGNVLAVGEAAGLTRPFSGEGIGPSLRSGMLAARCLLEEGAEPDRSYRSRLTRSYARDFTAFRLGERLLRVPGLMDALVRRVEAAPAARARVKAVLSDRTPSSTVLSPFGLARILLFGR